MGVNMADLDDFLELNYLNIPDLQQCVSFQKLQNVLNLSILLHCPKSKLNLCIKTQPVTVEVDANFSVSSTVYLFSKAGHVPLHPFLRWLGFN